MPTQPRDYYTNLFTPDSDSESSVPVPVPTFTSAPHHLDDLISQGNSILQDRSIFPYAPDFVFDINGHTLPDPSHGTMDSINTARESFTVDIDPSPIDTLDSPLRNGDSPPPIINFLNDDEIMKILEVQHSSPTNTSNTSKVPPISPDKIGCYNIQNKFDHDTAAEFFIKEDLSFLALQEPFASNYKQNESWKSFQTLEMQNARIQCFITPFQVVMYDTWKWGGKVIEAFSSHLHGRITSMAFNLGNKQIIGIISIYASTNEALAESRNPNEAISPFITSAEIVAKISDKWKHDFPDICNIIIGDMQETWSITDRDNMGTYRCPKPRNGILSLLEDTHCSIVREKNHTKDYITRIGKEGGRGIDHILFPKQASFQKWIVGATIDRFTGGLFFPSDHSFIYCSFNRSQPNNEESSATKTKFDYNKIFNIKLKRSGHNGTVLCFDETQFKDCKKFRDQKTLYEKIQRVTSDTSDSTDYFITSLEKRTKALFKNLWYTGISQNVDGPENKLVRISEEQAVEIAYVVSKFNSATKGIMEEMEFNEDD